MDLDEQQGGGVLLDVREQSFMCREQLHVVLPWDGSDISQECVKQD